MADLQMKLDDVKFKLFFENIKTSKLKTALNSGIRKSLNIIKKKAISNLKQVPFKKGNLDVNSPVTFNNGKGGVYKYTSLKSGVFVKVFKQGKEIGGRAEIIASGKKYIPILPMIENGKGIRFTKGKNGKKRHSTGSIANTFFSSAVQSTKGDVHDSLQKNLEDSINKAKEKFYK